MSLRVWLPLNGTLDNQGLDQVIVTNNGAAVDNNGKIGKCYSFDGNSSGININGNIIPTLAQGDFSICFWVYNDDQGNRSIYIATIPSSSYAFAIQKTTGEGLRVYWQSSPDYYPTNFTVPVQEWCHITVVIKNNNCYCYRNGILITSREDGSFTPQKLTNTWLYGMLGRDLRTGGTVLKGKMNDFRWYDHALSPFEIKQISQGLVLHYPLNGYNETLVPFGYQQLEYIEGNGSSYFNTGYKFNPEIDACKVEFKGNDVSNNGMIFADSGGKYFWLYYYGTYGIRVYADNGTGQQGISGISSDLNKHIVEYKSKHYYIDGVDKGSLSKTYTEDTNTIWLFSYGGSSYPFKGRIYYTDIKRNNKIQKIYIPAKRISDSAVGMYELVNNNFFVSASTAFTAGPVIKTPSIIYDCSGFINNGTVSGNLTISNDTPKYQASTYMPKSALITHPRPVFGGTDQEWTCAMWVKLDNVTQGSQAMNNFNISNNIVHSTTPLLYLNEGANDYYMYGSQAVSAGVWTHVAFVFKNSNGTRNVYINGVLKNNYGPNKTSIPKGILDTVTVGTNLAGYISDYRVYATALSAEDVKSLYNNSAYIDNQGNIYGAVYEEV